MMKKERLKNKLKRQNGITLIALVVTIIVLIILAVISINLVFNEGGIISKAEDAKVVARASSVEDEVALWKNDTNIANNTKGTSETESDMLTRLRNKNLITNDDEVDTTERIIRIKKKDGTVVKEISYNNVIINVSKITGEQNNTAVALMVSSVEGLLGGCWDITASGLPDDVYYCMLDLLKDKRRHHDLIKRHFPAASEDWGTPYENFTQYFYEKKQLAENRGEAFPYESEDDLLDALYDPQRI